MNVLIVSDSSDTSKLGTKIKQELKSFFQRNSHEVSIYDIQKEDMHYCVGCFNCWLQTPGECIFNDISRDINKSYIESDMAIFVSPIKYGCYTPVIRKTLDRILPNILPFFKTINGEIHHAPRYNKYPHFIAIGYGENITKEEISTFLSLTNANAINFQTVKSHTYIARKETDMESTLNSLDKYIRECNIK